MTTPQKVERWESLKLALFKQVHGLLYTTRIVNLMSTLQLSLTGQRYYNLELKKQGVPKKPPGAEEGSTLSSLLREVGSDHEEAPP